MWPAIGKGRLLVFSNLFDEYPYLSDTVPKFCAKVMLYCYIHNKSIRFLEFICRYVVVVHNHRVLYYCSFRDLFLLDNVFLSELSASWVSSPSAFRLRSIMSIILFCLQISNPTVKRIKTTI